MLEVGDSVNPITLKSQHDKEHTLLKDGMWIITWDKEQTKIANKYFENVKMREDVNLIVDVSQVPSGIFTLFVLPNMRDYKHAILLSFNEAYNLTLPYKEGSLTILHIKDKIVSKIEFLETQEELEETLK
jgi:hypothetical protein